MCEKHKIQFHQISFFFLQILLCLYLICIALNQHFWMYLFLLFVFIFGIFNFSWASNTILWNNKKNNNNDDNNLLRCKIILVFVYTFFSGRSNHFCGGYRCLWFLINQKSLINRKFETRMIDIWGDTTRRGCRRNTWYQCRQKDSF